MDRARLVGLLVTRGDVDKQACVKLSATRFVAAETWNELKRHEQQFLRCYAAALATRTAVLVGRSAAQVNGLWVLPAQREVAELATGGGNPPPRKQWPDGVEYRHMTVPEIDVVGTSRVRATRPTRTAVDIARFHGVRDGVVAMDSLLSGESLANQAEIRGELLSTIGRMTGKKGIANARRALDLCSGLSESPYESLFRLILLEHGIAAQEQMWIGPDARVDLLWDQVVIEIDGAMKYELVPHETVRKQLKRENRLREYGYEVVRVSPSEMLHDEAACVRRVIQAKARADARGPASVLPTRSRPYRPF